MVVVSSLMQSVHRLRKTGQSLKTAIIVVAAALPIFSSAWAEKYSVSITRRASNSYEIVGKNITIVTRYCYEYVYYEESVLDTSTDKLYFLSNQQSCEVKEYLVPATVNAGKYSVTISRYEDNLYEIMGSNILLQTSICLNLALGEEGILEISTPGSGTLHFLDSRDRCTVDRVLTRKRNL